MQQGMGKRACMCSPGDPTVGQRCKGGVCTKYTYCRLSGQVLLATRRSLPTLRCSSRSGWLCICQHTPMPSVCTWRQLQPMLFCLITVPPSCVIPYARGQQAVDPGHHVNAVVVDEQLHDIMAIHRVRMRYTRVEGDCMWVHVAI
jgi:hypothetical protein